MPYFTMPDGSGFEAVEGAEVPEGAVRVPDTTLVPSFPKVEREAEPPKYVAVRSFHGQKKEKEPSGYSNPVDDPEFRSRWGK